MFFAHFFIVFHLLSPLFLKVLYILGMLTALREVNYSCLLMPAVVYRKNMFDLPVSGTEFFKPWDFLSDRNGFVTHTNPFLVLPEFMPMR